MDFEKFAGFVLDQQAKTESRITTILGMIAELGKAQVRTNENLERLTEDVRELAARQVVTDQAIRDLAERQAVTEIKLQGLIDALTRNRNGHPN